MRIRGPQDLQGAPDVPVGADEVRAPRVVHAQGDKDDEPRLDLRVECDGAGARAGWARRRPRPQGRQDRRRVRVVLRRGGRLRRLLHGRSRPRGEERDQLHLHKDDAADDDGQPLGPFRHNGPPPPHGDGVHLRFACDWRGLRDHCDGTAGRDDSGRRGGVQRHAGTTNRRRRHAPST